MRAQVPFDETFSQSLHVDGELMRYETAGEQFFIDAPTQPVKMIRETSDHVISLESNPIQPYIALEIVELSMFDQSVYNYQPRDELLDNRVIIGPGDIQRVYLTLDDDSVRFTVFTIPPQ